MKILYIITQGEQGGAQRNVLDLAANFASQNLPEEIFVAIGKQNEEKDFWLKNELLKNGIKKENIFEIENLVREISFKKDLKCAIEIYKLVRKIKVDIVHVHSTKAGFLGSIFGKLAGAKVVYTLHGVIVNEPLSFFKKSFYWLCEFISSFFRNKNIFVSHKDLEIAKKYLLTSNKKSKVIYNGLDFQKFENNLYENEARDFVYNKILEQAGNLALPNFPQYKIVGTIANFYKTKGLEYLVDAAAKVIIKNPNVIFIVFGDGDLRLELEELIRKNAVKKNFFLLGRISDAYKYLKALDLYVMSSVKEGMPYALVEAALCDLKILSTNVGGIPEMKKYLNMILVDSQNSEMIAENILQILYEKEKWEKEKDNNQNFDKLEVFNIQKMIDETGKIYKSLM
jgi:glycosyltransferase involved in cell wall biosynthesis